MPAPPAVVPSRTSSPWLTFAIAAVGGYITTLDLSVVNVAFAEIAASYADAPRSHVAWVVTIYNIFFAAMLVVGGRTADRVGRKRVFLAGASVFGIGSVLCAVAPTLPMLVAGRAVQGLGAAFLTPSTMSLLLGAFPAERRTQVVSLWGGVGALGVASGPTLGALLITAAGWRAAFWINVPIVLGLLVVGARRLPAGAPPSADAGADVLGALMITVGLAALALGVSQSEEWGWSDARVLGSFAVVAVLAPLFVRRQARHPAPVVDLRLFAEPGFARANLATMLFFVGFAAMSLNNVLFLRTVWGYSVLHAGLASALSPLVVAVVSGFAGRAATRHGFRPLLVGGPLVFASSMAANIALLDGEPTIIRWLLFALLLGTGVGCSIPVLSSAAVAHLRPAQFGVGGALNSVFRQTGAVLGVALVVALQGRPQGDAAVLASFHRGWWLVIGASLASAAVSASVPRAVPARSPGSNPVPAPATMNGGDRLDR